MKFFGSVRPLSASVGGDGFAPSAPASGIETAPNGQPIVVYRGKVGRYLDNGSLNPFRQGLDANGQWWQWWGTSAVFRITPTDGSGFVDTMWRIATDYVAPAVAGIVAGAVAGPIGTIAVAGIKTWAQLARGASLTSAVIDQAIAANKSLVDQGIVRDAYNRIITSNLPLSQIQSLRNSVPQDTDSLQAFDSGMLLAKSKLTQDVLIRKVKASLPAARVAGFSTAMDNGGLVRDYIAAVSGSAGLPTLDTLSAQASTEISSGKSVSIGGGGASGASSGVVPFVLVVGVGYLTYRHFKRLA